MHNQVQICSLECEAVHLKEIVKQYTLYANEKRLNIEKLHDRLSYRIKYIQFSPMFKE